MRVRDLPPEAFDKPGLMVRGIVTKQILYLSVRDPNDDNYTWIADKNSFLCGGIYPYECEMEVVTDENGEPKYYEC